MMLRYVTYWTMMNWIFLLMAPHDLKGSNWVVRSAATLVLYEMVTFKQWSNSLERCVTVLLLLNVTISL